MQDIPAELKDHFLRGTAALFVGSDLSSTITGLPSRSELAAELAEREGLPVASPFSEVAELVIGPYNQRNSLISVLRQKLDVVDGHPSQFHQLVAQVPVETIITTAYDDLLQQAFREIRRPFDTIVTPSDIPLANRPGRATIVYLYGKLGGDIEQLILTRNDHMGMSFRTKKAPVYDLVRHLFQTRAILFLGYNLSDPDFELMYSQVLENIRPFHIGAWAASPLMNVRYRELWASKGIRNIEIEPVDALAQLSAVQSHPTPTATSESTPGSTEANQPRDSLEAQGLSDQSTIETPPPNHSLQSPPPTEVSPPNQLNITSPVTALSPVAPKTILGLTLAFTLPLILFLAAFSLTTFLVPSGTNLAFIFIASILATALVVVAVLSAARVLAPEQTKDLIGQIIGAFSGLGNRK
ncbi:MAG: SIR2 family protein [Dehalococcoidia bacterium]